MPSAGGRAGRRALAGPRRLIYPERDGTRMSRIDHIGVAVQDLEAAMRPWVEGLGLKVAAVETLESERVKVAMLPVGETKLELLEPTSPESAVAKFIEKRGTGIHHIALHVESAAVALEALRAAGVPLIDQVPRQGAGGTKVGFAHPKGFGGVLVEVVEGHH